MMESPLPLPVGYRFCPTDEEIILGYLLKKVTNQSLPSNVVLLCDLYGDEQAWQNKFQDSGEKSLYFFTNLRKKKTENGSRVERATASGGTWRAQKDEKIVYDGRLHIGSKKSFSYVVKGGSRAQWRWIMKEYRLDGCLLTNPNDNNYVLCQIRKWKNRRFTSKESDSISVIDNANIKPALTQGVEGTGESSVYTSASINFERAGIAQMEQIFYGSNVAQDDSGYLVCPLANASPSQQPILLSPAIDPTAPTLMESGFGIQGQVGCTYPEAQGSSLVSMSGRAMNSCS